MSSYYCPEAKEGLWNYLLQRAQAKTGDDCHALWIFPLAALVARSG